MSVFSKPFQPRSAEGWVNKAKKYRPLGVGLPSGANRSTVMDCYSEALKINPEYIPALIGMAECLRAEAISQPMREMFNLSPTFSGEKGCLVFAIEFCDKILNQAPRPFDLCKTLWLKGRCFCDLGEQSHGIQLIDEAILHAKINNLDDLSNWILKNKEELQHKEEKIG